MLSLNYLKPELLEYSLDAVNSFFHVDIVELYCSASSASVTFVVIWKPVLHHPYWGMWMLLLHVNLLDLRACVKKKW